MQKRKKAAETRASKEEEGHRQICQLERTRPCARKYPALAAARSSYRPAAKAPARIAEHLPLHPRAIRAIVVESLSKARALAQPHVNERRRRRHR